MSANAVTIAGVDVTRADVLAAIEQCDTMGKLRFLERFGYKDAVRWHLRHDGRSYPSKAIVGVAADLHAQQFFGGVRGAVQALARLGFECRNSVTGELASVQLDELRTVCESLGLDVREPSWPDHGVMPTAYFASGTNMPAEIIGVGAAGCDLGATVSELSPAGIDALKGLAGSDVLVFLDSGAFGEVKFNTETLRFDVVKPLDLDKVVRVYDELAPVLGDQLWLVAPDRVGNQLESLLRLKRHRDDVARWASHGCVILVPCQKGTSMSSQAQFAEQVDTILPDVAWQPAMPCMKAATTPDELAAFLREREPMHVHLLGLGIRNRSLRRYLDALNGSSPSTTVSLDSCWIVANAVRAEGKPRRLARAKDMAAGVVERFGSVVHKNTLAIYCCLAGGGLLG